MPDFGIFRGFNSKLFSDKLYAGQLPTQLGTIGSKSAIPFNGILDLYPNAAAAYSLRRLNSLYTGNIIKVRRSSDNTEQDIGYLDNGDLNISALTSFCGSGNGFVTTWYDQSGNARNATQITAGNQPQIVSAGSIITQNSKPILRFNVQFLSLSTAITPASSWSLFGVGRKNGTGTLTYFGGTAGLNSSLVGFVDDNIYLLGASNYISTNDSPTVNYRVNSGFVVSGVASFIYRNNTLLSTSSTSSAPNQDFLHIGRYGTQSENSSISEVILYQSNQISNNSGINTNINTYYGIY
jgi:hypothetical protein